MVPFGVPDGFGGRILTDEGLQGGPPFSRSHDWYGLFSLRVKILVKPTSSGAANERSDKDHGRRSSDVVAFSLPTVLPIL
jgi:hypothetical protein